MSKKHLVGLTFPQISCSDPPAASWISSYHNQLNLFSLWTNNTGFKLCSVNTKVQFCMQVIHESISFFGDQPLSNIMNQKSVVMETNRTLAKSNSVQVPKVYTCFNIRLKSNRCDFSLTDVSNVIFSPNKLSSFVT